MGFFKHFDSSIMILGTDVEKEECVMCNSTYIIVMNGKELTRVRLTDILLIERNLRKIRIRTEDAIYEYYERLENIEPLLNQSFFPCLKSCYINLDKIISMKDQRILFNNGFIYYLGRTNFIKTRKRYKIYLKNKGNT